jgi:hypothetical protein
MVAVSCNLICTYFFEDAVLVWYCFSQIFEVSYIFEEEFTYRERIWRQE